MVLKRRYILFLFLWIELKGRTCNLPRIFKTIIPYFLYDIYLQNDKAIKAIARIKKQSIEIDIPLSNLTEKCDAI